MRGTSLGVRLHAEIDFFGINPGEAHGLVALLKQRQIGARVEDCPIQVSSYGRTIQVALKIDRVGVIVPAESAEAAQQKLQGIYSWLNVHGPDYDVAKTRIFDGNTYREVI